MHRWPWSTTLLRGALAAALIAWLVSHASPAHAPEAAFAGWAVLATLVGLRWLAGLPDGARRAQGQGWGVRLLLTFIPAEMIGLLRCLALTTGGCLAWVLRRPPSPRPEGRRLEDRRKGFYDTLFAMNVISLMTEVPVLLLILSSVAGHPAMRFTLHALEAIAVVAVLGDRWLVQAGGHVLAATHLDLRAGARASARIPLHAIAAIEPVDSRTALRDWRRVHGGRRTDAGTVSVLDRPNVVITLHPVAGLTWWRWQVEREMPRHLLLYLDEPRSLAPLVAAAMHADPDRDPVDAPRAVPGWR